MATGTSPSAAPAARMDPNTARRGMFVLKDGRKVLFTFLGATSRIPRRCWKSGIDFR